MACGEAAKLTEPVKRANELRSAPARRHPKGPEASSRGADWRPRQAVHQGEPQPGQMRTHLRRPSADLVVGGELAPGPDRGREPGFRG